MYSMTGYGRADYLDNGISLVVEIKTVNNRNFDLNCKIPRAFIAFEDAIRKTVQQHVLRGRIDLFVTFADTRESSAELQINYEKALAYVNASKALAEKFNLNNDFSVSMLMKAPDVIVDGVSQDLTEISDIVKSVVNEACINLNQMRKIEGEKLVQDMLTRMQTIRELKDKIKENAPSVVSEYKIKLQNRIEEALKDVKYDEARLLNEVAFFTDKSNIDEELTRLNSHIDQFIEIIKTAGMGKKLDFLMQEFNRETNTICSKSNDIHITKHALELKNEIEKVREQVQNLE